MKVLNDQEVEELSVVTKDNSHQKYYQVIIVGGGPSGIATALTLNALGISNCIVEASETPNRKYGEAIPPNAKPLLKQLGIKDLLDDNRHLQYFGNKSCWGKEDLEQKEFISDIHGHGYLLDRLYFENQLWNQYLDIGGVLYNGFRLKELEKEDGSIKVIIDNGKTKIQLKSAFIVDATGRKASVARRLGMQKVDLDGQFGLSCTLKTSNKIQRQITVEATENGWWYMAPNGNNELTLMYFTLKATLPNSKEYSAYLSDELTSSIHIRQTINPSSIANAKFSLIPAGTSRLKEPYGDQWVAVGDAAFSYDPISSYGITSALASGYYAGQAISSHLDGKQEAMIAFRYILENAFQAYSQKLFAHYNLEQRWTDSYFWKNRFSL